MKIYLYIILFVLTTSSIFSAEVFIQDSVLTGPAYKQEAYYSLHDGQKVYSDANKWDIAFEILGAGYSVLSNDGYGVQVFHKAGMTAEDFTNTIDVEDVKKNWKQLYNSTLTWTEGAFVSNKDPENDFDLGWGEYSMATHSVYATTFYVVKTITNKWKKVIIDDLTGGSYNFRIANLDGTELIEKSLNKSEYKNRNFAYYSIDNDATLDIEPHIGNWDIVFTKYINMEGENKDTPYSVTGVKTNPSIKSIRIGTTNPSTEPIPDVEMFSTSITTIGSDWKRFDGTKFVISDTLVFFLYRVDTQKSFRLLFTGFGGSSTGKYIFKHETLATSVSDNETGNKFSLSLYPSVAEKGQNISVITTVESGQNAMVELLSVDGQVVWSSQLIGSNDISNLNVPTKDLTGGLYLITVRTNYGRATQKLIIQ